MVFNPAVPEIRTVTSEQLQLKVRQLLPSQDGFGSDLAAQNVIVPVIDLTAAAEASDVRQDLQSALAFGSGTSVVATTGTTDLMNTVGFWRLTGVFTSLGTAARSFNIRITDGATNNALWGASIAASTAQQLLQQDVDLIFWLRSGDTAQTVIGAGGNAVLNYRQIADSNGTLVQPSGFNPQ